MCRLQNIAMRDYQESVTTGQTDRQTDGQTDRRRTKLSLCAAMLRRRHKNWIIYFRRRMRPIFAENTNQIILQMYYIIESK